MGMKKGMIGMIGAGLGAVVGGIGVSCLKSGSEAKLLAKIEKFKGYYYMLNQWLMLKQEGKSLEQYFVDNGYKAVAIYGMGEMGNRLYEELKGSNEVKVEYVIDQNTAAYSEVKIFGLEEEFPSVDVIVVTATFAYDEIKEALLQKSNALVVSLNDVIYEID
ncbi:MAG: hypothetical protein HFH72_03035 [Lachnospiraceae bacterium]|nr:hypothetical protein [Lachnospiraceae bacterium]